MYKRPFEDITTRDTEWIETYISHPDLDKWSLFKTLEMLEGQKRIDGISEECKEGIEYLIGYLQGEYYNE